MALFQGRRARNPVILSVRPLTREDLLVLNEKRPVVNVTKTLKDSHHRLARLTALGLSNNEICFRGGVSHSRLAIHRNDPAFQELVAGFRAAINESFKETADDFFEVATANMMKAEVMISDKIDEALANNEFLPTKDLLAISRDGADRFGYPKQKINDNRNSNVDFAAQLEAAARRSGRSNVIDAVPNRAVIAGPQVPTPAPVTQPKPTTIVAGIRRRA